MATSNVGQIRTRTTLHPNYEKLTIIHKTKTVYNCQALCRFSRKCFDFNIHVPFLVLLAHKDNSITFLVYKIAHKLPISGFKF